MTMKRSRSILETFLGLESKASKLFGTISLSEIVLLLALGAMISCKRVSNSSTEHVVRMSNAITQTLYMSDYFESIEYIPLETRAECLIGGNPTIYVTNEFIVVINLREQECYIFDRQFGKFIRKIGNRGQGPEDYLKIPNGIIVNEQEKTIFFDKGDRLIEYSLTDRSALHLLAPIPPLGGQSLIHISDNIWSIGYANSSGSVPNRFLFFDRTAILDSIPNYDTFTLKNDVFVFYNEVFFYRYNNNVYYKPLFNDTIYKIVDMKLQPEWVFEMNKSLQNLLELRLRDDIDKLSQESVNYHFIFPIFETNGYLFFNTKYQRQNHAFMFDKQRQHLVKLEQGNFINDIDGGLNFWMTTTNQNQDLICMYQAYLFKEEINNKELSEQSAKKPLEFKKLRTLVAQMDEEDNPIIVIAKLKQ